VPALKAPWPPVLPSHVDVGALRTKVDDVAARSPYGWGHTIDFGPYRKEGLLADYYLNIACLMSGTGGAISGAARPPMSDALPAV
jgi:hypothetical protein